MWTLSIVILSILFIVFGTLKYKIDPFIMLLLAAIFSGIVFGIPLASLINIISNGFGQTLSSIGIVIVLGAVIGVFLEKSNGINQIVSSLLKLFGKNNAGLALNFTGFITAIPVFCDAAFVILSAVPKALAKKTGFSLGFFGVALATGLYAAHVFIPPTPGPLAAAAILEVPLSEVLWYGLVVSIPVSLSGYFYASFFKNKQIFVSNETINSNSFSVENIDKLSSNKSGNGFISFLPILVPILFISISSFYKLNTSQFFSLSQLIQFFGNPIVATFIGVLVSFMISYKTPKETKASWVSLALKQAGVIILITGAGGSFGAVLKTLDFSSLISFNNNTPYSGLLIAFVFAAIIKSAQGSSTVSILTTAAFMVPIISSVGLDTSLGRLMTVLSIGAGAMTISHVNDSYFWVVTKSLNLSVKQALIRYSLATLFQGITGIIAVLFLYALLN
jgi:GntP family gluconate:H+ symporter|tara:strand:+ start:1188 stop:2531 length:1344 start_codon:yes stop_codon:yes gene_type:complete